MTAAPDVLASVTSWQNKKHSTTRKTCHAPSELKLKKRKEQGNIRKADKPDVERSLLIGPQRPGARAHAVVHHLLPQVVDFGLKTSIF